ncbi:glycosyltransferase family 2 protein [Edwardsiella tarda]|uniref:glycosyltransferase family 2 protein n=1 Tax=Edwardsiella tarda TaxID=636 RepID=UPI00351C3B92
MNKEKHELDISESDIMSHWNLSEPIQVSICCITYKQEQYIEQAIDGFLMQNTSFPFEIIIGEDCGGDGTLLILKRYQSKYPNLIKIISSGKNIGANANLLRVFEAAKGKYIAFCEGDDYWCNKDKLQYQFDKMESDSSISFCIHSAKLLQNNKLTDGFNDYKEDVFFDIKDVISTTSQFSPSASYFFKRDNIQFLPDWFCDAPIGDVFLEVYMLSRGKGYFFAKPMSVYRVNAENSWSQDVNNNFDKFIFTQDKIIKYTYKLLFDFPELKPLIDNRVFKMHIYILIKCLLEDEYSFVGGRRDICHDYNCSFKYKLFLMLLRFPRLMSFVLKIIKQ